ncbi:PREDICTED: glutathione S-transferase T2-like [Brassica oleracea var. oleracea]|uniref:glutathione S-transferase T2-like n=1 Tax=Brassica oleracea var. oleracea TaxID=109376 RepID=UPI0006A7107A|nr:PREDICTED: glutathione S-transferase T2-like [Brassica oleracea var. oleracea]
MDYIDEIVDKCLIVLLFNALKLLFNALKLPFPLSHLLKSVLLLCLQYISYRVLPFPLSHLSYYLSLFLELASEMDSYPSSQTSKFVDLLNSQQSISFGNYEDSVSQASSQAVGTKDGGDTGTQRRERRRWTPADDIVLISVWLNTSKYVVVRNEQKSSTFWSRVAAYYSASRQDGEGQRGVLHCKQRWHKINDLVCKFCGAYEAASREKTNGQNENDVLKLAHQILYTNHKKKFFLEYAWKELRNDQKWCEAVSAKNEGIPKKRKCELFKLSTN